MPRRKTRTRRLERAAALAAALCLTGCGGGDEPKPPPQPKLPTALASSLAERSDAVAAAVDAGDSCRAREEAARLREQTIAAINAGRVPGPFQEPLAGSVNELVARIECVTTPPPVEDEENDVEDDDKGRGGKGKGKGKKKGDD